MSVSAVQPNSPPSPADVPPPADPGVPANPSTPVAPAQRAATSSPGDAAAAARGFLQDLGAALHSLATLKIVTVVGDVAVSGAGMDIAVAPQSGGSVEAASTEMDMFDARITNVFTPKFSALDGGALYQFHQAQVGSSVSLFNQHVATLKGLASDLLAMRR